jgi:hypothetical protein
MDRDEAIRLLKGGRDGVWEWNERRRRGEEIPDLGEADLRGADLVEAHLGGAHLGGADLRRAHLRRAHLIEADLRRADLSMADLSMADLRAAHLGGAHLGRADLSEADLRAAHLSEADLRRADLSMAHLDKAHLGGADLGSAICERTVFGDVDLSEVKGLESITHEYPSTVGVDTLVRSRGRIPEAFLRGCGVPDTLIEYLPSILGAMQPIQFYSCFISYSTKDDDFAKRLHSRMVQEKLRVWFAPEDIQGGKKLHEQIDEAIRVYDKLLLVLSRKSMGSEWVKVEIRKALKAEAREGRRKLFPIRLVDLKAITAWKCLDADGEKDLAEEVREYHIPDFTKWEDHKSFEAAFARLIKDLEATTATDEETQGPGRKGPPKRP